VPIVASAEQWRSWAAEAIQVLLDVEGAATQPGMEAKLSDRKYKTFAHRVDPHHLTTARQRLLAAGVIERQRERTRGSGIVTTYTLADPSKSTIRTAGRKRLLQARFLSWSSPDTKWGAAPVPAALERVVHASLLAAAPHGYRPLRPEGGGEVRRIANALVPGGQIDNAAFYTGLTPAGLPVPAVLLGIEAKNVRQWIYPQTQEMYQLLDKCAQLRLLHPELRVLPVLVCRKAHYLTNKMARQLGFHVIATQHQYVRPAVAGTLEDARKFEEVNTELAYNLQLREDVVDPMVNHFTTIIPGRSVEAADRWAIFVSHPDVPNLLAQLRDDAISNADRTQLHADLIEAATEALGEDMEWTHDAAESSADGATPVV
jgi:hypothetical protein